LIRTAIGKTSCSHTVERYSK